MTLPVQVHWFYGVVAAAVPFDRHLARRVPVRHPAGAMHVHVHVYAALWVRFFSLATAAVSSRQHLLLQYVQALFQVKLLFTLFTEGGALVFLFAPKMLMLVRGKGLDRAKRVLNRAALAAAFGEARANTVLSIRVDDEDADKSKIRNKSFFRKRSEKHQQESSEATPAAEDHSLEKEASSHASPDSRVEVSASAGASATPPAPPPPAKMLYQASA